MSYILFSTDDAFIPSAEDRWVFCCVDINSNIIEFHYCLESVV